MNYKFVFRHCFLKNIHSNSNGGAVSIYESDDAENLLVEECIFIDVTSEKEGGVIYANASLHALVRNSLFDSCYCLVLRNNYGGNIANIFRIYFSFQSCSVFKCYHSEDEPGDSPIYSTNI